MISSNNEKLKNELQGYEIDQLDLQVIKYLQVDGRIAYSLIAREIGVPEATIRYRVKRLLDEKIIMVSAFINTGKLKYENVVYVELDVDPIFFEGFLNVLVEMENISYISSVTGEFNIMLEYIYKDNDDLFNFLNWIKQKKDVRKLQSRTILKIHKAQYPVRVKP